MTDECESPLHPRDATPRSNPGEHLWRLLKGTVQYDLERRDDEERRAGRDLELCRNDEFLRGRGFKNRALALAEANALHAILTAKGWIG